MLPYRKMAWLSSPTPEKTEGQGTLVMNGTPYSSGLSSNRIPLHPLLQIWQRADCPRARPAFYLCAYTRLISDMSAQSALQQI